MMTFYDGVRELDVLIQPVMGSYGFKVFRDYNFKNMEQQFAVTSFDVIDDSRPFLGSNYRRIKAYYIVDIVAIDTFQVTINSAIEDIVKTVIDYSSQNVTVMSIQTSGFTGSLFNIDTKKYPNRIKQSIAIYFNIEIN